MIRNLDAIKAAPIEQVVRYYIPSLKAEGPHFVAKCPFHEEHTPSFVVTPAKQMFKCFGCDAGGDSIKFVQMIEQITFLEAVARVAEISGIQPEQDTAHSAPRAHHQPLQTNVKVTAILTPTVQPESPSGSVPDVPSKLVAIYPYTDAQGELLYEVCRFEPGRNGKKKDFLQRRRHEENYVWGLSAGRYRQGSNGDWRQTKDEARSGDVELAEQERVLFGLPALTESDSICFVEGERDVLTVESLGYVGTTISGGSKAPWLESYTGALRDKRVIIFPDNDAPGEAHGRRVQNALKGVAREIVYVRLPADFKDITEFVEAGRGREQVDELVQQVINEAAEQEQKHRGLLHPIEVMNRSKGGLEAFLDPSKQPQGLKTGFTEYDALTLGLYDEELTIWAARPAMGKSTLLMNTACGIAKSTRKAVAIFSLEMSAAQLLSRMVCAEARVNSMRFRTGFCDEIELKAYEMAARRIAQLPIYIDDSPGLTLEEMRRKTLLLMEDEDVGFVGLDYLQLLTPSGGKKSNNRNNDVSDMSRGLKLLAREIKKPVIALSQLSRSCETRPGDHRPMLSDLRDSGGIEADSDVVAFVYREEVYRPDKESLKGIAEIILGKQRNGPIGRAKLAFLHRYTKFENLAIEFKADNDRYVAGRDD